MAKFGLAGGSFSPELEPPFVEEVNGVRAISFNGERDWLIGPAAPESILGNNPHSIEAWIFNPEVGSQNQSYLGVGSLEPWVDLFP